MFYLSSYCQSDKRIRYDLPHVAQREAPRSGLKVGLKGAEEGNLPPISCVVGCSRKIY